MRTKPSETLIKPLITTYFHLTKTTPNLTEPHQDSPSLTKPHYIFLTKPNLTAPTSSNPNSSRATKECFRFVICIEKCVDQ